MSVIYKNAVDSRRPPALSRTKKPEGKEQLVSHAREYIAEVERELQKIRDGILAIMDKNLIPSASTDESKVLYYKMKSDYYRYLAECATGDAKGNAAEGACVAHGKATKTSERDLVAIHPVRLGMALNTPVVAQRQKHMVQTVQMPMETPQLPCIDKVVDVTVATQQVVHVPQERVVEKIVEIPQLQIVGEIVRDTQTSDSLGTTPVCQVAQTGHVEVVEIETSLPTESASAMFVSTPVPQAVEELVESSKTFSQNRVQQSSMEQIIANNAISLAEKTVEMPVSYTSFFSAPSSPAGALPVVRGGARRVAATLCGSSGTPWSPCWRRLCLSSLSTFLCRRWWANWWKSSGSSTPWCLSR